METNDIPEDFRILCMETMDEIHTHVKNIKRFKVSDTKSLDISDVSPWKLHDFLKEHNIPEDAEFDGEYNGYDAWQPGKINVTWKVEIDATDAIMHIHRCLIFKNRVFKEIYLKCEASGKYSRKMANYREVKDFITNTIYEMYLNKEFDNLVAYYAAHYKVKL